MNNFAPFDNSLNELSVDEINLISGGQLGPDQNPSDFPPWALPYIRTAGIYNKFNAVALNPQPLPPKFMVFR